MDVRRQIAGAFAVCFVALLGLSPAIASPGDGCPPLRALMVNAVGCGSDLTSTIPAYYYFEDHCLLTGHASVIYDHIGGKLAAYSTSLNDSLFETSVWSRDDFVIDGPTNSATISLRVTFNFNLSAFSEARLAVGADTVRSLPVTQVTDQTMSLDLHELAGQHFIVGLYERTFPVHRQDAITGEFRFSSLPAGYTLRSCYGYAALPVGVRNTTWTRVKQIYR
jgi:hypothetical protein